MIFVRLGTAIAWALLLLGALRLALGLFVAVGTADMEMNARASARYLGSATSGEAINEALFYIALGVTMGLLTEISKSLRS